MKFVKGMLHYGPDQVPAGVWEMIGDADVPILSYVLEICPCAYFHLPHRLKCHLNEVRQLMLHHGHMWPMIPPEFRSNTGLMLMALQSAPQIFDAYMHEHVESRGVLANHPIVEAITSVQPRDWNPLVERQRDTLKRTRPTVAVEMPSFVDDSELDTDYDSDVQIQQGYGKRSKIASH